jgi:hypothetical protein
MQLTKTAIEEILQEVYYPGFYFLVGGTGRLYLQAWFIDNDIVTGEPTKQYTRKWYISCFAIKDEVVSTALKCVLTALEHEAREKFLYRGERIFGPHFSVDFLVKTLKNNKSKALNWRGKDETTN